MSALSVFAASLLLQTAIAIPVGDPTTSTLVQASNFVKLSAHPAARSVEPGLRRREYGVGQLEDVDYKLLWATEVDIGGDTVLLQIDTGSSDTWTVASGYQCVNASGDPLPKNQCGTGKEWNGAVNKGPLPEQNFRMKYGGGAFASGTLDLADVTVGGIKVKNQEFGVVNTAYLPTSQEGDYQISGLLGLGFAARTSAYVGNDSSIDNNTVAGNQPGDRQFYSPIVETMIAQGLNPPIFSFAIERPAGKNKTGTSDNLPGGYISFGGLPPVVVDSAFATTDMLIHDYRATYPSQSPLSATNYTYYSIQIDGYTYPSKTGQDATFHAQPDIGIVDTGATALYLPTSVADAWYAAFSPPPYIDQYDNAFYPCNAAAALPPLGIRIAGKEFLVDPRDMLIDGSWVGAGYPNATDGLTYCWIAVLGGEAPFPFVLGDVFHQSVVSVFDWGKKTISFAEHVY